MRGFLIPLSSFAHQRGLGSPDRAWGRGNAELVAAAIGVAVIAVVGVLSAGATAQSPMPANLPQGFVKTEVFSELTEPTVVRFAPNGRVYVAEKSGLIKTYDSIADKTPTVFADLRTQVHNFWDRGLLGMSLDFNYGSYPWVYALFTHDAPVGGTARAGAIRG